MPRLILSVVLFLYAVAGSSQRLLRQPLSYVPAQQVLVLPHDQDNIILDIMAVNQFLAPRPVAVSAAGRKAAAKVVKRQKKNPLRQNRIAGFSAEESFLLTGHAAGFDSIEHRYFQVLPGIIRNQELPIAERERAGQDFLDCTGIILATDNAENVYVNLYENCSASIQTPRLNLQLDIISDYPVGPEVKFRIGGLEHQTPFTLRIRLQNPDRVPTFYINGRAIPTPVVEDGYFVISRKWRNHEEVFFYAD